MAESTPRPTSTFDSLPERDKRPGSKRHLDAWVQQAQTRTGIAPGRLGWLVASSVALAALQRARHHDGLPRFLLKGGAYLEVRLGLNARSTRDVDTLFRGDFADFLDVLDTVLAEPWGALSLSRSEVRAIEGARRTVKPRRFMIKLAVGGQVWRSVDVEVAPDEGHAGEFVDLLPGRRLGHFGLPSPPEFAGIAMDYQVAQKFHASTDPHDPPEFVNDRARDLVDLHLLRTTFYDASEPLGALRSACLDIFTARAAEAALLAHTPRTWPPTIAAHRHWRTSFASAATDAGLVDLDLDDTVVTLNAWIGMISQAE